MPPAPSSDVVIVERHGMVALLVLNRPDARNALDAELARTVRDRLREAEHDPEVRAVVLAGAGPAFCAGADLRELPAGTPEAASQRVDLALELHGAIPAMRTPVVAAVGGPAVAGGCGLALACDLVVASEAAWFGYPEVRRGLVPALVMVGLQRLVGRRVALDLLLTGRRVAPEEARALGMVTEVVAPGQEVARALERAAEIATFPASAVGTTKELLGRVSDLPFAAALRQAAQVNLLMRTTADARAGSEAFVAGRGGKA